MSEIEILAFAKINLYLEVLKKRDDGYHEVETIFQSINLSDTLHFVSIRERKKIVVFCNHPDLPLGRKNLVYQAAQLVFEKFNLPGGVKIEIKKKIPVGGGLGGGSTDAAATLIGLTSLYELDLSEIELWSLAQKLGCDVPFFLKGGTALGKGRGDKIASLAPLPETIFLLVLPGFSVSTTWAYQQLNAVRNRNLSTAEQPISNGVKNYLTKKTKSVKIIQESIERRDCKNLGHHLYNRLEKSVFKKYPELQTIKEDLLKAGASGALMSGSGSTIFGIFPEEKLARGAAFQMKRKGYKVLVTQNCQRGWELKNSNIKNQNHL
ncbi:MAG: 4-(cytidine 5'-diphospho)-2-C-methyl-D-erythritol kinase [Candidatus Edwardsbacteria bacterium]